MEFFNRAKAVRLRSQHNKYLIAGDDEDSVKQGHDGTSKNARWIVEHVEGKKNIIRLKSCHWKYLAASNDPYLLGWTGKKAVQASPRLRSNACVEWEPIKEGIYLKLRTKKGMYLRANGGMPPWRSSVTHDSPKRTATQDWVLWKVDVLDIDHSATATVSEEIMVEENPPPVGEEDEVERRSSVSSSASAELSSVIGSPAASFKSGHSFAQSHQSNSFKHLKSVISDASRFLDDESDIQKGSESLSSHPLEVRMAKQILNDVMDMDFESLLSSGRLKRVDKAISVLSKSDDLNGSISLQDRFISLKSDYELATNDLTEYASFSSQKLVGKREFQRDLAKAQELERIENECGDKLATATARKEELLKELAEIEKQIKDAEERQATNAAAVDQLIVEISDKSENLKVMDKEEKLWQPKKAEAEKILKEIEEDWVQMKSLFQEA